MLKKINDGSWWQSKNGLWWNEKKSKMMARGGAARRR